MSDEEVITLREPPNSSLNTTNRIYRDDIELEKGVVITNEWLERNERFLSEMWSLYTAYPDIYLDMIKPKDNIFSFFPYQRMFLRSCMRYTTIFITAARATSKTFLAILAKYLQCMFIPNHVGSIVAPTKGQAAKIARQKIEEIWRIWPLLKNELEVYNGDAHANFGKDYVTLYFKNGASLSIGGALDTGRGLRTHAVLLDEARDLDGDMVQQVILPQMNVSRRMVTGLVNPHECINRQVIYATSAGMKSSYAYNALIDTFEKAIIDPKHNFCIGLDYRIPVQHGLIESQYVKELKLSSSYNELTFASEFMSVWQGGSDESWFNFEKLAKYRKIKNPEWSQKFRGDSRVFYLISVDVGRLSDQSVACIFRVNINDQKYYSTLVNIFVLGRQAETKTFTRQAIDLKKLVLLYNPREVVIDTNGLGIGLADEMIKMQVDDLGNTYPALGFFNNDDYKKIQPKDAPLILYSIKANGQNNSKIHGNAYTRLNSGMVRFLISEQEARSALLATKTGAKMTFEQRVKRLMPHELTTKLFDEMANLRLKHSGLDIVLEQINSRFPKDKYSAFAYGQWRIKELEEAAYKKQRRHSSLNGGRKLVFFSGGT